MANKDKKAYKIKRCTFLTKMFITALMKGQLNEPKEMENGIDFKTKYLTDKKYENDKNYFVNRGFIERISPTFTNVGSNGRPTDFSRPISYLSEYTLETSSYPDEKTSSKSYVYFITYLRAALWYSPEEFQEKYPLETFPLVNEKFNLVVNHMKELGFDIEGIVNGPEE